mmetsp:Transcript_20925/g.44755  ORF Transcript_20925/g.44755 Transcript_20925/m.44755 type:complete len:300 (+) Transcript_20925:144-1043(+)|eukprot:CAMPEP_0172543594 /NCGR_PEP_ID=MMETSP1067-20121228/13936_1 /TAXON_ID=265564 ORGANISM="Thalassiosira punctigera, Strain Tpunct2005C2" /NCGR_SAMPLE_ID=MMETSP1067 /ASSEMBLY_ACC=CAM_ASM_000444 /LENGTH=299 /DNA_ID=CAMNT_0013330035 /DNA_START=83 /DNA_END=979 /DNA_ORIENTATION=+
MPLKKFIISVLVPMLLLQVQSAASFSTTSSQSPSASARYEFRSFEFDPLTGICRRPASFQYTDQNKDTQFFVMRNTPGDGDCVFHAVLSSVFISAGILNPDSALFSTAMSAMALEMRNVVAMFLSSPEGTLYVNNKPHKRIVRCRDLLQSAAKNEGFTAEDYLTKLRQPGKQGGLYGGGPELTVLSNILRRPISIYHLKQPTAEAINENFCEVKRMGVFGEGLFEDPGQSVPDSVVSNAVFFTLGKARQETKQSSNESSGLSSPLKCSWHLHILIADASETEKHATVLLPSVPILHNNR